MMQPVRSFSSKLARTRKRMA